MSGLVPMFNVGLNSVYSRLKCCVNLENKKNSITGSNNVS